MGKLRGLKWIHWGVFYKKLSLVSLITQLKNGKWFDWNGNEWFVFRTYMLISRMACCWNTTKNNNNGS